MVILVKRDERPSVAFLLDIVCPVEPGILHIHPPGGLYEELPALVHARAGGGGQRGRVGVGRARRAALLLRGQYGTTVNKLFC